MQMHELQKPKKQREARRVGRGGKRGTYSGRGMKGQKSRAGAKIRPEFRSFFKRVPKLRGTNGPTFAFRKTNVQSISLGMIDKNFEEGDVVSPKTLVEHKAVTKINGRLPLVKILFKGAISKAVNVEECMISASARKQIEKAGGSIK